MLGRRAGENAGVWFRRLGAREITGKTKKLQVDGEGGWVGRMMETGEFDPKQKAKLESVEALQIFLLPNPRASLAGLLTLRCVLYYIHIHTLFSAAASMQTSKQEKCETCNVNINKCWIFNETVKNKLEQIENIVKIVTEWEHHNEN